MISHFGINSLIICIYCKIYCNKADKVISQKINNY